jgi:L-asparaginase
MDSSFLQKIVVLGTGGTLAGLTTGDPSLGQYIAGEVGIEEILSQIQFVSGAPQLRFFGEQVFQIDSKDWGVEHWQALLARIHRAWEDPEVKGVVITHGTDTLEETAFLLAWILPPDKPVVLTGAMRAFDAQDSDGLQNLTDALAVMESLVRHQTGGVYVVMAQQVFLGSEVQKMNATSLQAFGSSVGPRAPESIGRIQGTHERLPWEPPPYAIPQDGWPFVRPSLMEVLDCAYWPRVEIVMSHAGLEPGGVLEALLHQKLSPLGAPGLERHGLERQGQERIKSQGLQGLVIAGTGSGTWSRSMAAPLMELMDLGVWVIFTSRLPWGREQLRGHPLENAQTKGGESDSGILKASVKGSRRGLTPGYPNGGFSRLSPVKARIALVLHLLASQETSKHNR